MLNWNGKNAKLLSWGDKTIQRAYLGDKLVFEKKKPSRLPEGYTELKYITSTSSSSISDIVDTFNAVNTYNIEFTVSNITKSGCFMGSASTDGSLPSPVRSRINFIDFPSIGFVRVNTGYGASTSAGTSSRTYTLYATGNCPMDFSQLTTISVSYGKKILKINNDIYEMTYSGYGSSSTAYTKTPPNCALFYCTGSVYTYFNYKVPSGHPILNLHELIFMKGSLPSYHYIPAKNEIEGTVGLYDIVNLVYKPGNFTAGPEI